VILGGELFAKLSWPVYSWINLPAELGVALAKSGYDIGETYFADHHQIHVARCVLVATCIPVATVSKEMEKESGLSNSASPG